MRAHADVPIPCVVALILALIPIVTPAQSVREYRAERGDAGTIRGPLSDFWFKVRSEWSGYRAPLHGSPAGSGPLQRTTHVEAPPNRVWVSLVHGDRLAKRSQGPLAHLYTEFLSEWKKAEGLNWPYAQILSRRWSRMGRIGRRQNIIMIGTPWQLPPVGPLAGRLGITIEPGSIRIGSRRYRGDNLLLLFIAPNPFRPEKYAMVISGSTDESLLRSGDVAYGKTDYVLFRGRRLLESGYFSKARPGSWGPPSRYTTHPSHRGFSIRESEHFTFWYETGSLSPDNLAAIVRDKERVYPSLAGLFPPGARLPRITYYLYPSIDRKIDETARDDVTHIDLPASQIHAVVFPGQKVLEPYLDLQVLIHDVIGPTRVPRLERAVALALAPSFQGSDVADMAPRIFTRMHLRTSQILDALQDQDVMTPADGPPAPHDLLLAGFMRHLLEAYGRDRLFAFLAAASPAHLGKTIRKTFDHSLSTELFAWAAVLRNRPRGEPAPAAVTAASPPPGTVRGLALLELRRDDEAARALEESLQRDPNQPGALAALARLRFRNGRSDDAVTPAQRAIARCAEGLPDDACADAAAWAHLTLGRIEALRGHHIVAHMELTDPAVAAGPETVHIVADYWLQTMGMSRNQLTVVSHLKHEATVGLRRLDWRGAESYLNKALELDPTDAEAHRLLSEVYHKQHEYWAWELRYLDAFLPEYKFNSLLLIVTRAKSIHSLDSFNDLVLRGNLELMKAQSLYAVEIQNLHAEADRYLIQQHDLPRALELYQRALEMNKDFFLSYFLLGRCYFLMDETDKARAAFDEVLWRRPRDKLVRAWTHTYLGFLGLRAEDFKHARRSFIRALKLVEAGREAYGRVPV
ncbi:MAG: tetratricopeptide repeat protein, partial [Acidobacteriota bacterium]